MVALTVLVLCVQMLQLGMAPPREEAAPRRSIVIKAPVARLCRRCLRGALAINSEGDSGQRIAKGRERGGLKSKEADHML